MTSTFEPNPLQSEKPACTIPSISTRKRKFLYGSTLGIGSPPYFFGRLTARDLLDAEDDELGGLDDRDANQVHDLPRFAHLRRVGILIAFDEERLLGRLAEQRARPPLVQQKIVYGADDALPKRWTVRLKDHELRPLIYGLAQEID